MNVCSNYILLVYGLYRQTRLLTYMYKSALYDIEIYYVEILNVNEILIDILSRSPKFILKQDFLATSTIKTLPNA